MADVGPAPAGLAAPGRRFWEQVTTIYVLTAAELALAARAARLVDVLDRLERKASKLPDRELVVEGSLGQLKTHPLFDQILRADEALGRLLERLKLPSESALPKPQLVPSRGPHGGTSRATG